MQGTPFTKLSVHDGSNVTIIWVDEFGVDLGGIVSNSTTTTDGECYAEFYEGDGGTLGIASTRMGYRSWGPRCEDVTVTLKTGSRLDVVSSHGGSHLTIPVFPGNADDGGIDLNVSLHGGSVMEVNEFDGGSVGRFDALCTVVRSCF